MHGQILRAISNCYLAAIGGDAAQNGDEYASVRVYFFDEVKAELRHIFSDFQPLRSTIYCSTTRCPNLAAAGSLDKHGNSLWIYRYEANSNTMVRIMASDAFQGKVYTISWLCNDYGTNPDFHMLALGGKTGNGSEVKILSFNRLTEEIFITCTEHFGATVYALELGIVQIY